MRKVYYNLVITALSIGAAFIIGTIEILGVLTSEVHLHGAFWDLMANFNINLAGFCIAGLFVAVWAAALVYWRVGNVEDKWTAGMAAGPAADRPPEAAPGPYRPSFHLEGGTPCPPRLRAPCASRRRPGRRYSYGRADAPAGTEARR